MDGQDYQGNGYDRLPKGVNSWKFRCNGYVRSAVVADKKEIQSNGSMGGVMDILDCQGQFGCWKG